MRPYTKAQLQEVVLTQLENLEAMHDLLNIIKNQNELLKNLNSRLKDEIREFKEKQFYYPINKRKPKG